MSTESRSSIGVRVRPNANNFIKDLRADLSTKKFTFYANVGADTKQATRDVRMWARDDLRRINATVNVGADTKKATSDVAKWRAEQRDIKLSVPVRADMSQANRDVAVWRQTAGRDLEIRVKANVTGDVDRVRRQMGKRVEVDVRANTRRAVEDIRDTLEQPGLFAVEIDADTRKARYTTEKFIGDVRGEQLSLDLDVDTTGAKAHVAEFDAMASNKTLRQQLDLDTKQAKLDLLKLRIEAQTRKLEVGVRAKKSDLDRLSDFFTQIDRSVGNLTVLRSLDLGPLTLGKPTGLIGTLTTLTALAGAAPAAVTGVAALSKAIMDLAGAASIAPGAIAGLLASMSTIALATNGIGDTFGAMFDMWNEGASEQAASANSLVSAQNSYRNAVVDEAKAQRDVGRARRDALHDLRDLNNELRGAVLNEAQAILDAQAARDRYAQGGFKNQTEELQARLDIAQADQRILDVREEHIKLGERAAEAQVNGVEGSDKVVDAMEAATRAAQATASAAAALSQAGNSTGMTKFLDELGQLSPAARDFVLAFSDAKGLIQQFQQGLQETFFAGLGPRVRGMFDSLLPSIEPGMTDIAKALNQNILQVFDTLESPDGKSIIERILGGTAEAQRALTKVLNPLIKGFGTLAAAGAEHLPQVVELIGRLADRFASFIDKADKSGALDAFMDRGVDALSKMAEIGINVIKIVHDLASAFQGDLLQTIVDLTAKWHTFLSSDAGKAALADWIRKAGELWDDWRPILEDLPALFSAASDAAKTIIDILTPFLNAFTETMEHAPWLIEGFITAWLGAKVITGVLQPILGLIQGIMTGAKAIPGLLGPLRNLPVAGPGGVPGAPPAVGGAGGGLLGGLAVAAGAGLVTGAVTDALITTGAKAAAAQPNAQTIDSLNATLPPGAKPISGVSYDLATQSAIRGMAEKGDPAFQWVMAAAPPAALNANGGLGAGFMFTDPAAELEFTKRYVWLMKQGVNPNFDTKNFVPPPSYGSGGYTPWAKDQGRAAVLHGNEFIQPSDTVDYYGLETMRAMHQRQIPKEFFTGFEGGDYVDPNDPRLIDPAALAPNPYHGGGVTGALTQGVTSGINAATNAISTVQSVAGQIPGGPTPGGPTGLPAGPFGTAGPAPGPAMPLSTAAAVTASAPLTTNIMGFDIPLGNTPLGWPGGQAPVGLGGGSDGFDIRKFGIGPGPVGSTPSDWGTYLAQWGGETATKFADTLATGFLGFFGLEGLMNNPYINAGKGLAGHFAGAANGTAQGAGAADTNAQVNALLSTYGNMATNPAYPGAPSIPGIIDPTTGKIITGDGHTGGEAGLQVHTLAVKRAIEAAFPQITNIGGVRADRLKWHPNGLAVDVMIPGGTTRGGANPQGKALGDQIYAWLNANKDKFDIDYMLWQTDEGGDHYNHIHVNTRGGGYPPGQGPMSPPAANLATADSGNPGPPKKGPGNWVTPGPGTPLPASSGPPITTPQNALDLLLPPRKYDGGGWVPPGLSMVTNQTRQPELMLNPQQTQAFSDVATAVKQGAVSQPGGMDKSGRNKPPERTDIKPAPEAPAPTPPPIATSPNGPAPAVATPPAQESPKAGPGSTVTPVNIGPGDVPAPMKAGSHLAPWMSKGIRAGASAIGQAASTAIGVGAGAAPVPGAGAAGAIGPYVAGLIQQGGKIVEGVANVAASFLVGNITSGTTQNPYGVQQRGANPRGSTIVDNSTHNNGDVYTQNLDDYFKRMDLREAQKQQAILGRLS